MSPSPRDSHEEPTRMSSSDDIEKTSTSFQHGDPISEEMAETCVTPRPLTPRPVSTRIKAPPPRRYILAVATETGPRMLAMVEQKMTVGRLEDNGLCLQHGSVSRRHAVFELTKQGVSVADLGSQNGTSVNGEPTKGHVFLKPGDIVRVGYVALFYFGFMSPDDPPQVELVQQPLTLTPLAPSPG